MPPLPAALGVRSAPSGGRYGAPASSGWYMTPSGAPAPMGAQGNPKARRAAHKKRRWIEFLDLDSSQLVTHLRRFTPAITSESLVPAVLEARAAVVTKPSHLIVA